MQRKYAAMRRTGRAASRGIALLDITRAPRGSMSAEADGCPAHEQWGRACLCSIAHGHPEGRLGMGTGREER
ncbi:MAG: hypothetical protein HFH75_15925 [Lachnospiraceae bacterium]|nr:hypothetical protein [Lachnospiraceae bacterium]